MSAELRKLALVTVRADFLVFGYREITIEKADIPLVASLLLQNGIRVSVINDGCIFAKEKDIPKASATLSQ